MLVCARVSVCVCAVFECVPVYQCVRVCVSCVCVCVCVLYVCVVECMSVCMCVHVCMCVRAWINVSMSAR